ncbi:MAG: septum formation initiator family protein [Deltaproteobacteria bacterium]|uniref:Septum formation initiator family protein n=1 Tax=Candidatus Zymogenus saltonus TaxID=2844893 RepID=A0A9D8PIN5_9DELT|nr:septum formation initiator family protein [Candidatus Zymogenus saltonus]
MKIVKNLRQTLTIASVVVSLTILGFTVFGKRGFISFMTMKERKKSISLEIESLQNQNSALKDELIRLKSKEYRERVVRSKMGMAKDGEVIYIFTPE